MRSESSPRVATREQQRRVAVVDGLPVDARHVQRPEVVALQAPDFAQHLPPLARRVDGDAHAREVDPAALARRRVGLRGLVVRLGLAVRGQRAQPLALANDERRAIVGEHEAVHLFDERLRAQRFEVEELETTGRLLVAAASVRADDRQQRPDHLVAGDPRDLPELAFGHRKRGHAAHDAGQVDAHRRGRLLRGGLGGGGGILRLQPLRRRIERRRRAGLQRDQVRPRGARERQLELHAVVHRVERAHRQEVQVAALRVERGRVVAELRLRDERRRLVRDVVELDRAVPRVGPELVRDPAGVRRPREVLRASRVAAVDHGQRAGVDVAQQHLVAMVGDRHLRAARRRAQLDHAADVPRQHARRAVLPHVHALLARLVADGDERRAVGEPLPVAMPRAFRRAVLAHRAFPQPERDELAAHVEREAVPGRVHGESAQVVRGGHELARRLRAMRGHVDRDPARRVRLGIEAPQVRAALVDDARAVGLRVPRVEVVVIGVPAPVRAVGLARVEIAHALGVRQVVHAVADPHRAGDVAGQLRHPPERAAAVRVDPQVPGRAAAIALPARGVRRVAADDLRVAGSQREVIDLSQRQQLRHAARGVERERAVIAEERLAVRRHEEHVPFRRPAAHHHVGPEPRQAPRRAAFGRHHVDLRVLLVAADERQLRAVGRKARRGRLPQSCRQAPRDAAVGADGPQVVVADEDDRIAADRGMTQISLLAHGVGVHACDTAAHRAQRPRWGRERVASP